MSKFGNVRFNYLKYDTDNLYNIPGIACPKETKNNSLLTIRTMITLFLNNIIMIMIVNHLY